MLLATSFLIASLLGPVSSSESSAALTTAAAINKAIVDNRRVGQPFDLTATVIYAHTHKNGDFTAVDDEGTAVTLWDHSSNSRPSVAEGSRFRIRGTLINCPHASDLHIRRLMPSCTSFDRLCDAKIPEPDSVTVAELQRPNAGKRLVMVSGLLRDAFRDEIDPNYIFIVLNDGADRLYAEFSANEDPTVSVADLLGQKVTVSGIIATDLRHNSEHLIARHIDTYISTHRSSIRLAGRTPTDPFDVPPAPSLNETPIARIDTLGRCRITGHVIALWKHGNALLKTDSGQLSTVKFTHADTPACGAWITVSGIPSTDTYQINLHHAIWRTEEGGLKSSEPPLDNSLECNICDIVKDEQGRRRFNSRLHGRALTLCGRLILPGSKPDESHVFYIEQDGEIAKVDCSSVPDVLRKAANGSVVRVTGTCVMEVKPGLSIPHITDFLIAIRKPEDLCVTSRPPWWSFGKFMTVLSVISTILATMTFWAIMLKRLSERRGVELANERLAVVESELKVCERTRLAIELHDMLSQTLTGISMQIDAVRKFFDKNKEKTICHLDIAANSLRSCRENLRDCLWDLRNQSLEEQDLNKAIRNTLEPHADKASVSIRFNVPRNRLTDNATHAILCVIRELSVNAIRHGKATAIKIAGSIEAGQLLFSVRDNGCGFEPDAAPGVADGHFGLQGVRERVEGLGGETSIESLPGRGTKVTVTITLPQNAMEPAQHV